MNRQPDRVPNDAPGAPAPAGPGQGGTPRTATGQARWEPLWREAADGARQLGDAPLHRDDVARLWSGLRVLAADEPAVPDDLVPGIIRALLEASGGDGLAPGGDAAGRVPVGVPVGPEAAGPALVASDAVGRAPVPGAEAVVEPGGAGIRPAGPARPGLVHLARLLWAEARWLPLPFLVVQLLLAAGGLLLHLATLHYAGTAPDAGGLAGTAGWRGSAPGLTGWQLILASADSLALVAPWLGTLVALAAVWPRRRQLWADLEALSPFPPASRLLARTWVAGVLATALLLLAGWLQPAAVLAAFGDGLADGLATATPALDGVTAGPAGGGTGLGSSGTPGVGSGGAAAFGSGGAAALAPGAARPAFAHGAWMAAAVVLARVAPLWLAAAWTLWWQVRIGTLGAMGAAAALWTAVTLGGRFLGPWNPLAAGPLPAAGVQVAMLAVALLLAWHLRGRAETAQPAS